MMSLVPCVELLLPADVAGAVLGAVLEQEPSEWIFEESFVEEMGLAFPG